MKNNIIKFLKKIPGVLSIARYFKFRKEFKKDFTFFRKNYSKSSINSTKLGYDMLLTVHSLEKGMSNKNPRYFGIDKVNKLMSQIKEYELIGNKNDYPYVVTINCIRSYAKFYEENNWTDRNEYISSKSFIDKYQEIEYMNVGSQEINKNSFIDKANIDYKSFLESRHSIRDFANISLKDDDVEKAIKMTLLTPSACNRQMCKIYYIKDNEKKEYVKSIGQGFGNFDLTNANLFIVTFDVSANYFIGERNQGWFNAGLFSMNFVNALHSLGIGSCFVQFGNTNKEEELLKNKLGISNSERVAVIITAGYYPETVKIPYSTRKSVNDIYRVK